MYYVAFCLAEIPFGKYNTATKPYAAAAMSVAKECGTMAVDLFTEMSQQEVIIIQHQLPL